MITLLRLYFEFAKVGLFSIGGGLATLPFLYDLADRTAWFTHADVANMIAIAPGAIGINMATYAGYVTAGALGGFVATIGLISPAIIIIYVIARLLNKFMGNKYVESAFYGLRPASIALIAVAGLNVAKITLLNWEYLPELRTIGDLFVTRAIILAILIFWGQKKFKKLHPVVFIAISAVVGIVFHFSV